MGNNFNIMGTTVYIDDEDSLLSSQVVDYVNEVYNKILYEQSQNGGKINTNIAKIFATFYIAKELCAMKGNNENFQDKNIRKVESLINFIDSLVLPEQ